MQVSTTVLCAVLCSIAMGPPTNVAALAQEKQDTQKKPEETKRSESPDAKSPANTKEPAGVKIKAPNLGPPAATIGMNLTDPRRKRIAIIDFDYATVQTNVRSIFGRDQDIGKGMADLLTAKLAAGATYSIVDRKSFDKIVKEQSLSNSGRVEPALAARIGKQLNVDAILIASVTRFGSGEKKTTGSALGKFGKMGKVAVSKKDSTAVVSVTARLIDVNTGEVVALASGSGESTRSGTGIVGAGGNSPATSAAGLNMASSGFSQTILGEAVHSAVNNVAQQLEAESASVRTNSTVRGSIVAVADASDGHITLLDIGQVDGLKVGDRLVVWRVTPAISDPVTGPTIRNSEELVGELTVTSVGEKSAEGKFEGAGTPKVGDAVVAERPRAGGS